MGTPASEPSGGAAPARHAVLACGLYAALVGVASFAGWALDVPRLTDWFGHGISILPNTALAATCAGIGLMLTATGRRRATWFGAAVGLIGTATLLEHLLGVDFGIDDLFTFGREWGRGGTVVPGRMGPPASTAWMLTGLGIMLLRGGPDFRRVAALLGMIVSGLGAFAVTGYVFDASAMHAVPTVTAIAASTGTVVLAVGLGLLAAVPERQPVRRLQEHSAAGVLTRRMLPVLLVVPLLAGFLRVWGEHTGLYDTATGTAMLVLLLVGLLSTQLWVTATAVREHERQEMDALAALRDSEERFRSMADNAPVMVRVTEPDGTCTFLGRSWYDFTGQTPESGLGFAWLEAVHPDDRDGVRRAFLEAHARGEPFRLDYRLRRHDGVYRWALDSGAPRFGAPEELLGYVGSVIDITERQEMEQALRESDRRKDEFLAMLAHELRNPLGPIQHASRLLASRVRNDAKLEHACEIIGRQTSHLTRLVDDLLDASRISSGKIALRREALALEEVVAAAVEVAGPLAEKLGHTLLVSQAPEPIHLQADFARLVQVVTNLLTNAAKFTPPGGRITLATEQAGGWATIRVRDTGMGIRTALQERIFDLFAQEDPDLARTRGGLGIGLTLVKRIVELHGGTVSVHSDGEGHGSEFVVTVPSGVPALRLAPRDDRPAGGEVRPLAILLVEDNVDAAESFAMLLELGGHELRVAHDGRRALEIVDDFLVDVAFVDVGLPGIDGYEVASRLRAHPSCRAAVLVALTGYGRAEDRQRALAAGFDHHMTKPVDLDALSRLLAEASRLAGSGSGVTAQVPVTPRAS